MDIHRIDLNLLRLVEAVLSEGSASRAARKLRISQPAVSQGLRRAREVFGDTLLARHGNRLMPTPRGIMLLPELREILDRIDAVLAPVHFEAAKAERDFIIGASDLAQVLVLPKLLARFAEEAPLSRIKVVPPPRDETAMQDMDIALMGAPDITGPLEWRILFQDRFVFVARHGHPALSQILNLEDFTQLSHVLVSPRAEGFHGPVDVGLSQHNLSRRVVAMVPSFMSLLPILEQSELVAAVPQRFAELPIVQSVLGHRALPLVVPDLTMRAVWPKTRDTDPAGSWLREMLASQAAMTTPSTHTHSN